MYRPMVSAGLIGSAKARWTSTMSGGRIGSMGSPRPAQCLIDAAAEFELDRLARSVPDARAIADALIARNVRLALGASVYDPADPMWKMFFNILASFAEFEADLIRLRTREGAR